ncbi:MAG: tRNA pseudouridine(55) synthase TruB [Deltaproteobacteria bacterium]|nr:tRNA pseudouridine(55) synthase TruB [Deltaproteobacteria bacterium]
MTPLHGILLIDKPEGVTSAAVVRTVKKTLAVERVGHLGTLDPFASGLLPICLGEGTKIAQFLMVERKAYRGTIRLGAETDTYDITGTVTRTAPVSALPLELLQEMVRRFSGESWQTPPMYSALKHQGTPLYKLARRGVEIDREPRKIVIEHFALAAIEDSLLQFSLVCSKGTYIRTLAVDIGQALGCGAYLATLRRTGFGPFGIEQTVPLDECAPLLERGTLPVLSLTTALQHYPAVVITTEVATLVRQGRQDILSQVLPQPNDLNEPTQMLGPDGTLVAMVQHRDGQWQCLRVFSALQ